MEKEQEAYRASISFRMRMAGFVYP